MFDKERGLYIAHSSNGALSITGKMANRHGLIAGATSGYGRDILPSWCTMLYGRYEGRPVWNIAGRKDERLYREAPARVPD